MSVLMSCIGMRIGLTTRAIAEHRAQLGDRAVAFVAIGVPIIIFFAVDAILRQEYVRLGLLGSTGALTLFSVWRLVSGRGGPSFARPAVASFATLCLYLIVYSGDQHARALWLLALPLVAILLLPPREGGVWTITTIAGAIVLMLVSGEWPGSSTYTFNYMSRLVFTAALITGAVLWSELLLQRYQSELETRNGELARERDQLKREILRRTALEGELRRLATTDALTGLLNRRAFLAAFAEEQARSRRSGKPFALVMLDIDRFKQVNDCHGHPAGDAVLVHLAQTLPTVLRATDIPARLGGEEFAVLIGEADSECDAESAAERILETIRSRPATLPDGSTLAFTASGGGTMVNSDEAIEVAMSRADAALYAAKAGGRDRLVWR